MFDQSDAEQNVRAAVSRVRRVAIDTIPVVHEVPAYAEHYALHPG